MDSALSRRRARPWHALGSRRRCEPLARSSRSLPRNCCSFKMECCLQPFLRAIRSDAELLGNW